MEEKDNRKKEQLVLIIILILIAISVIVFLLVSYIGTIEHKPRIPTGNVDIFDIIFEGDKSDYMCDCDCHKNGSIVPCNKCKNNAVHASRNTSIRVSKVKKNTEGIIENNGSEDMPYIEGDDTNGGVIVYDKDVIYSNNTKLNIFSQASYYVTDDRIAPDSENSYQFVVRNNNDFNIMYNLEMSENNMYNINMRYRLKLNGKYVVGNDDEYVTFNELNQYNMGLADKTYDVYTLDWKWVESSNDTQIGREADIDEQYKLNIKITANAI